MQLIATARRTVLAGAAAVVVTAGSAAAAQAATVHGTVVHHNARAHSFVVADRAGHLYAIHAAHSPAIGSTVAVSTRRLRNGTYAARWTHTLGRHTGRVTLRGVVSYVNRRAGTFTLSARGVSMLVRTRHARRALARIADAGYTIPSVGTVVTATGNVDDQGDLNDDTVTDDGQDQGGFDLEGAIMAVDTTARTITVSSTDDDTTVPSVVVSVPTTLDISMFSVGQEVELTVTKQADGTYVLSGSSDDQGEQGADDQGDQQGDQGDDNNDQGDDSGSTSTTGTATGDN
jgi:hypothetical protein